MDSILIIAGENSGDKYGASLVHHFKKLHPNFAFFGIGGKNMATEGVELLFSIQDLSVIGGIEALTHLPRIKKIFNQIHKEIKSRKPKASILIDSPDFNLRLAKKLKQQDVPVLYYVSPTVWAWRKGRLKTIKKTVTKMMLIFPFEGKTYKDSGIPAVYVGHPLFERVRVSFSREELIKKYRLSPQKKIISLLPGSRKNELKYHMRVLPEALRRIRNEWDSHFLLLLAESLDENLISDYLPLFPEELTVLTENHYEAMAASDLVLSACGTANLEAALLEAPLLVFYRISPFTYSFFRLVSKIDNFSIVNILSGKKIVPELIQRDFTHQKIFKEAKKILESEKHRSEMIDNFKGIKKILGEKIAPQNAAQELEKIVLGDSSPK
jgi:lipid-A-disaccharide synthase